MAKTKRIRTMRPCTPGTAAVWGLAVCLLGGAAGCTALLALFALLLAKTPLPMAAARPMGCIAAAAGAEISGYMLAKKAGRQVLLCGLGAGVFYALCLAAAAWMQDGAVHWQGANAMLPLAVLLGGCFGGAAAALKGGR